MPRLAGQIDRIKAEAALKAANQVILERGFQAPLETIAKRAGVSKQTLYNHYGGKNGLVRAVMKRRVDKMTAVLTNPQHPGDPEATLASFAKTLMTAMLSPSTQTATRAAIQGLTCDMPDFAVAMHEAGSIFTRERLAAFFEAETKAGRLAVDDAAAAAEVFMGATAARLFPFLIGAQADTDAEAISQLSARIAHLFVVAYKPRTAEI
jgi:AcrR family transcriptional regulator